MPSKPCHRGPDPEDARLFGRQAWPSLGSATRDLCWLLDRGYAMASSVELVGNRYALARRQRLAVMRCACATDSRRHRLEHHIDRRLLRGQEVWLDGFNVLTALEVALSGGVILEGCDGCYRDIAGLHSRYRQVQETLPAILLVGQYLARLETRACHWWLDRPVSNSGRLKEEILSIAARNLWEWQVDLVFNPDKVLAETDHIAATSDSVILDRCRRWANLVRWVIDQEVPNAQVVRLICDGPTPPAG
ncbi:MAG TPA: DUF434 domain-containing protein [Candidatus Paceibacterota bacterium]|nr:DUF434 domain-containing protein [Verrucomicrobiota bacterium]HRY46641.1 DUF434 domain-containing protein [Candidatus Paceibacterota bacterium]